MCNWCYKIFISLLPFTLKIKMLKTKMFKILFYNSIKNIFGKINSNEDIWKKKIQDGGDFCLTFPHCDQMGLGS